MCVLCGITQSIPLLAIGYTPTEYDMEKFLEMNKQVVILSEMEQLNVIEERIDKWKQEPTFEQSKKKQYYIGVLEDFISREQIFNGDL